MNNLVMLVTILVALGLVAWRLRKGRLASTQILGEDTGERPGKTARGKLGRRKEPALSPEEAAAADARAKERVERLKRHGFAAEDDTAAAAAAMPQSAATWSRPNPRIAENVSVVLKRQVPVRFDEPVRSWLGGLPSLPDSAEWPRGTNRELRDEEPRPLHFVAQLACADLPKDLWAGLGPREGWLLFFINANTGNADDIEHFRVIHTAELGSERQPPDDIEVLRDGTYADYSFNHWLDRAAMPRCWVRWPVDMVTVPNTHREEAGRSLAAPADLAATLYEGAAIAPDNQRMAVIDPFSWRCLSQAWAELNAWLEAPLAEVHPNEAKLIEQLKALESLEPLLGAIDTEIATWAENAMPIEDAIADVELDRRQRVAKHLTVKRRERDELAMLLEEAGSGAELVRFLDDQRRYQAGWRRKAVDELATLAEHMSSVDPDSPLSSEDWQDYKTFLKSLRLDQWHLALSTRDDSLTLEKRRLTLWDSFKPRVAAMTHEVAAQCYTDAARRHLLPDHAAEALEPFWRRLDGGRPHRVGGYHDGVQSDATEGPTEAPLLLQLASDESMRWCWGDSGVIYATLETGALSRGDFWAAQAHLECH